MIGPRASLDSFRDHCREDEAISFWFQCLARGAAESAATLRTQEQLASILRIRTVGSRHNPPVRVCGNTEEPGREPGPLGVSLLGHQLQPLVLPHPSHT
jgi:hypothetical protein